MLFYADRISENIRRREPEGYLICVNVPIARSGTQKYMQDEVGQNGDGMVTVYRPEEEVFSKATMASFEGMPVTNDHPQAEEGVTVDNIQWLQKGHCQNVRRGTGAESNMLIADLVITDPVTIQEVLDGKREISCGYNYELCDEDGKLVQRQIRGNHVAIVDRGRAGHRVCIKDSYPNKERSKPKMAKKHNILAKMLAAYARDEATEPEDIDEAVDAISELTGETEQPEEKGAIEEKLNQISDAIENLAKPEEEVVDEDPVPAEDLPVQNDSDEKLDKIIALLEQLLAKGAADEEPAPEKDPLEALEDDLDEIEKADPEAVEDGEELEAEEEEFVTPDEDPEEPDSQFVDPEEINEQDEEELPEEEEKPVMDCSARDAMRAAIKAVKPLIAKLPPSERRAAADSAAKSLRASYGMSADAKRNDYIALKQRKRAAADRAAAQKADMDLGKQIMAKRNVNYKK